MKNIHNLNISQKDIQGLCFLDYTYYEGVERAPRWVRVPYLDATDLAHRVGNLDFTRVKNLRIQALENLIEMVDCEGRTNQECVDSNITFTPLMQKIVWQFGAAYEINKEVMEITMD